MILICILEGRVKCVVNYRQSSCDFYENILNSYKRIVLGQYESNYNLSNNLQIAFSFTKICPPILVYFQ